MGPIGSASGDSVFAGLILTWTQTNTWQEGAGMYNYIYMVPCKNHQELLM